MHHHHHHHHHQYQIRTKHHPPLHQKQDHIQVSTGFSLYSLLFSNTPSDQALQSQVVISYTKRIVQWQGLFCLQNVTAHTTDKINYTLQAPWVICTQQASKFTAEIRTWTAFMQTFYLLFLVCLPIFNRFPVTLPPGLPLGRCEPCNLHTFFWNNSLHFTFYCYKPLCQHNIFFLFLSDTMPIY